jgi:hypothetical protein
MPDYPALYEKQQQAYNARHWGEENLLPFVEYRFWVLTVKENAAADAAEERYNFKRKD